MKLQSMKYGNGHAYLELLRFATILFVSVILFSVATIPSVASQTATTLTSILTTTGLFTSSSYSTAVVASTTLTATMASTIISTINTVSVFGISHCSWDLWTITVNPGTSEITGTIGPSSASESFYILNQQQYNDFQTANSECGGYQGGEVQVGSLTSAYSLDWVNPPPGTYYVMFYAPPGSSSSPFATPFTLVAISTQEQTSTIYSVATTPVTVPTTQTMTSLEVSQIAASSPLSSIPGFPWESLLLGFLIGLGILVLKRSKKA